jgi:hypothetical protein
MFNLTFYDKPNMSVERTPTPYIITNPIYGLIILSFFCLIIIYLGYREFQKNRLLNKQVKGKITQGNCRTNLTRVSDRSRDRRGVRANTTCIVNYKYTVDNKELDGVYTGDMFTETQVGKEVTIYYNDKEPTYSSMHKNVFMGGFVMFFGLALLSLVVYSMFIKQQN